MKCLCLFLSFFPFLLPAYNFEVEGEIVATSLEPDGRVITNNATKFMVAVEDGQWVIKNIYGENWYALHGCDGTNIYSFLHDETEALNRGANAKTEDDARMPATVTGGVYPLDAHYYITIPWLAYASSSYLDQPTNAMPAPWRYARADPYAWAYEPKGNRSTNPPALPLEMKFVTSEKLLPNAGRNPNLRVERLSEKETKLRSANFTKMGVGMVGATYSVLATTNFNGLEIPLEFEMKTYLGAPLTEAEQKNPAIARTSRTNVYNNVVYRGKVSRVGSSSYDTYAPAITDKLDVTDFRFRDAKAKVDFVQYEATNKIWLSQDDAGLISAFKSKVSQKPNSKANGIPIKKVVVLVVLGSVLLMPLALWKFVSRKK